MRKLALAAAAGATLMLAAVPAMAQVGFYVGPGGFSVGVGGPYPYYDYYAYPHGYYDYYGGPVVRVPGWHRHWRHHWPR